MPNNGQNIVVKKWFPVAHSPPDKSYRKKLKVRYIPGTICEVFRYILEKKNFLFHLKKLNFNLLKVEFQLNLEKISTFHKLKFDLKVKFIGW